MGLLLDWKGALDHRRSEELGQIDRGGGVKK